MSENRKDWIPEDGPRVPFGLFQNSFKKSDNHPDYKADFTITDTFLRQVVALRQEQKMAVIGLAGWLKESSNGPYVSCQLAVDTYRTAKRYGVDEQDIIATINGVGGAEQSRPAPPAPKADGFLTTAPVETSAADSSDPFAGAPPLSQPDDDLPF